MRSRTIGQNVPFFCGIACGLVSVGKGVFAFRCAAPLRISMASRALEFISSLRSLLVQNHISSGMAFST